MIKLFLPSPNKLPLTITELHKTIGLDKTEIRVKSFCQGCGAELGSSNNCENSACSSVLSVKTDIFSYVDFSVQLKKLVKNHFREINRHLNEKRSFIDLVDSSYYKKIKKENKLHLLCYTDGVQLVECTVYQCWPVVCSLVELPCSLRDSIQNKVVCGVWIGKKKPTSDTLFSCVQPQLDKINEAGILVEFEFQY